MRSRFPSSSAGPSQRMLRVGEMMRHALAEIFARGEILDPVVSAHVITVTEVRMSPDLKIATIYMMPLGGKDSGMVLKALAANARFIRGQIAHRLRDLKYMPDLRFRIDEQFDEAQRIEALLRSPAVARDLDPKE